MRTSRKRIAGAATVWALALLGVPSISPAPQASDPGSAPIVLERVIDADSLRGTGSKLLKWVAGTAEDAVDPMVRPYGLAWLGDDLLVADPGVGRVLRLGRKGKVVATSGAEIDAPVGIAACAAGVVVTEPGAGRVALLDDRLRLVRWVDRGLERPTGVACDGGRLWIVETGRHRLLTYSDGETGPGESLAELGSRGEGPGEFNFPVALAAREGQLWVGDTLNFRVQRLDVVDGLARRAFGALGDAPGEMPRIKGLAVDRAGRLWISDAYLDQVAIYEPDGTFLDALGGPGSKPGEFAFPAGIAAHRDGRVAVADSLNRRVQVFRVQGAEP